MFESMVKKLSWVLDISSQSKLKVSRHMYALRTYFYHWLGYQGKVGRLLIEGICMVNFMVESDRAVEYFFEEIRGVWKYGKKTILSPWHIFSIETKGK